MRRSLAPFAFLAAVVLVGFRCPGGEPVSSESGAGGAGPGVGGAGGVDVDAVTTVGRGGVGGEGGMTVPPALTCAVACGNRPGCLQACTNQQDQCPSTFDVPSC